MCINMQCILYIYKIIYFKFIFPRKKISRFEFGRNRNVTFCLSVRNMPRDWRIDAMLLIISRFIAVPRSCSISYLWSWKIWWRSLGYTNSFVFVNTNNEPATVSPMITSQSSPCSIVVVVIRIERRSVSSWLEFDRWQEKKKKEKKKGWLLKIKHSGQRFEIAFTRVDYYIESISSSH